MTRLPTDFKDFLKSLNQFGVEYLLIGGYAVGMHGYPRPTGDMDVWVAVSSENADRLAKAIRHFGFDVPNLSPELLAEPGRIVRMGHPPMRIEILNEISGVSFRECYERKHTVTVDDIEVPLIGLADLIRNKRHAGRQKDLMDLDQLPPTD